MLGLLALLALLSLSFAETAPPPLKTVVQGLEVTVPIPPYVTDITEEAQLGHTQQLDSNYVDLNKGILYCTNFEGETSEKLIQLHSKFVQQILFKINSIYSKQRYILIEEDVEHFFCSKHGLLGKLMELVKFLLPQEKITLFFEGPENNPLYRFPDPVYALEDDRRLLSNVGDILFYFVPALEELDKKSLNERNEIVLDTLTENIFLNHILKNNVFENLKINETTNKGEYDLYKILLNATSRFKIRHLEDYLRQDLNETLIPLISKDKKASRSMGSLFL